MIDYRHTTFLLLCEIKNVTKTAEALNITQPAVTQHIRYLETLYGGTLVTFTNRKFALTNRGERLYKHTLTLGADSRRVRDELCGLRPEHAELHFGATLTIGDYVMPQILERLLGVFPQTRFHMEVHNTQTLLQNLSEGKLDFVLIEGFFDKSRYESLLFSAEQYIAVCAADYLPKRTFTLEELFAHRLIIREKGSGTRRIFEQILEERNFTPECFASLCEAGSIHAIKQLVQHSQGISFLYRAAAAEELKNNMLKQIDIKDFAITREFNFVFLPGSGFRSEYVNWYERFKSTRQHRKNSCSAVPQANESGQL